jgi:hypothetical protein
MIHIVTPFYRKENLPFYLENLKKFDIIWHPIFQEQIELPNDSYYDWINPIFVLFPDNYGVWEATTYKLNLFTDTQLIEDNNYYCFMNDDDFYEDNFFDEIRKTIENKPEVIFVSMKRGDKRVIVQPGNSHPANTLYAVPESIKVNHVSLEQYIIRGDILRQMRFSLRIGDGHFAVLLKSKFNCVYRSDIFVQFNLLQPGRWNNI